jgi:RHS repeat-associated protein
VDTDVAGEHSEQVYPGTNQMVTVSWDGRDVYGRLVGGSALANFTIAYLFYPWDYFGVCCGPEFLAQFPSLFGNDGNSMSFEGHIGVTQAVGTIVQRLMTYPDHRQLGLGGWSPTPLHRFDPVGGILYYGDGRIRKVPPATPGNQANQQFVGAPASIVAAAPDGSIYFYAPISFGGVFEQSALCRQKRGGAFEVLTQPFDPPLQNPPHLIGENWSAIDGQPTTNVSLAGAVLVAMAAGPDGSVYVSDGYVIVRLAPDGIWHVIMGLNAAYPPVYQPDGTLATNSYASQGGRLTMTVGPDSSVYYSCAWTTPDGQTNLYPIRKIAPNGIIYTAYGARGTPANQGISSYWYNQYGLSAFAAPGTGIIQAIAAASDGTIYVSPGQSQDGGGIFQISPGGVMLPFLAKAPISGAGEGYDPTDPAQASYIQGDEGKLAGLVTSGNLASKSLAVGPDGAVYFSPDSTIVWRVDANGALERVAGRFNSIAYDPPNYPQDAGDPLNTYLATVTGLAVTPENTLVVLRTGVQGPYALLYPHRSLQHGQLPTTTGTQNIPSEDGSEVYLFADDGRHLATVDGLTGATTWSFQYGTNNLVATMTDNAGLVTQVQRDGAGHPTAIIGPYGQTTRLGVDANGFLSTVTNPASETTTLTNSSGGLLLSITGPLAETYRVAYDPVGRATRVTDPLGGGWTDSYSNLGVLSNSNYEVDLAGSNSLVDTYSRQVVLLPSGSTSETYYAGTNNNLEQTVLAPNGDETFRFSDGSTYAVGVGADPRFGNLRQPPTSLVIQLSPGAPQFSASFQRTAGLTNPADPLSLTALTNVATINNKTFTDTYTASNRTFTSTTPAGRKVITVLDKLGRVSHVAQAGVPTTDLAYDSYGRLQAITNTSSAGRITGTFAYDSLGQVRIYTDPLGRSLGLAHDADGRVAQEILPDGSPASFTYDSEYDITSVTPPGRPAHTFQYNAVGLLTNYTPPLAGANSSVSYAYDTERNLTQIAFPDGQMAALQYGWFGQLTQIALGSGPTLSYNYGGPGGFQLLSVTNSDGDVLQYSYTGPVVTSRTWSGSITGQVATILTADLLPGSDSVNGTSVAYTYDPDSLITQAGALSITNDPASGLITGTSNGVVTDQRLYDDRGLLINYTAAVNGTPIWSIRYGFDLLGRITNRVEALNSQTQTTAYAYDVSGRLQQIWLNGALSAAYSYDTNGNRLARNAETGTYDAQDRVLTYAGSTFSWSPNGTLLSRLNGGQTTAYTYDLRGALTAANISGGKRISYVIDATARRIGKKVNGTLQRGWLWDGDLLAGEVDGHSSLTAMFVFGADSPAPSYMITPTNTYRLLSDERGSVRLVVNTATGAIVQQLAYDEFGRVTADTNPGFQPLGFAGGLYDPDTGLVRFGARDYSPETGQWTARDPLIFAGGAFNLYAYAVSDPINVTDPLGTGPFSRLKKWELFLEHHLELPPWLEWPVLPIGVWGTEQAEHHLIAGKGGKVLTAPFALVSHTIDATTKTSDVGGEFLNAAIDNRLRNAQTLAKNGLGQSPYQTDVDHGFILNYVIYGQPTPPEIRHH